MPNVILKESTRLNIAPMSNERWITICNDASIFRRTDEKWMTSAIN